MKPMTPDRKRGISLVVMLLIAVAGLLARIQDTVLLVTVAAAFGLLLSNRSWRAFGLAGGFVVAGLLWSSLDSTHCSTWWKGKIVTSKLAGDLPFLKWSSIADVFVSPCYTPGSPIKRSSRAWIFLTAKHWANGNWNCTRPTWETSGFPNLARNFSLGCYGR